MGMPEVDLSESGMPEGMVDESSFSNPRVLSEHFVAIGILALNDLSKGPGNALEMPEDFLETVVKRFAAAILRFPRHVVRLSICPDNWGMEGKHRTRWVANAQAIVDCLHSLGVNLDHKDTLMPDLRRITGSPRGTWHYP